MAHLGFWAACRKQWHPSRFTDHRPLLPTPILAGGMSAVRCFVIGPIGDRNAPIGSPDRLIYEESLEVFETIVRPACEALGMDPVRADKIAIAGEITEQICRHLRDDEVVIADVTDANPNVMYELGLRHSRDLLTLPIGEEERLPFDISVIRTIRFKRDEYSMIEARRQLQAMLESGLSKGWDRVTPTRVWLESNVGLTLNAIASAPSAPEDAAGFLELLATMEDALPSMTKHLGTISELIQQMGQLAIDSTPGMHRAQTSGAKLLLANEFADKLEPLAESLETAVGAYADTIKAVDPGISYLFGRIETEKLTEDELEAAREFLSVTVESGKLAAQAMVGFLQFADIVAGIGSASRKLREPTARVARTSRRLVEATETVKQWSDRAAAALSRLPPKDSQQTN
jgi:hypothetical protein